MYRTMMNRTTTQDQAVELLGNNANDQLQVGNILGAYRIFKILSGMKNEQALMLAVQGALAIIDRGDERHASELIHEVKRVVDHYLPLDSADELRQLLKEYHMNLAACV